MRILIYSTNFAPEPTGIGKYSGEMAEWLAQQGHEVRAVAAPPYYPEWRIKTGYAWPPYRSQWWQGVRVHRAPLWVPRKPGGLSRVVHLVSFAVASFPVVLAQALWRPHLVMMVAPAFLCAPAAWLVARLCGGHAWLHVQDFEIDIAFQLGLLRTRPLQRALLAIERFILRRFDTVSTISHRMIERLLAKGVAPASAVLFPNWVDTRQISPVPGANQVDRYREELGIAPDAVVALFSGTLGGKQGLMLLPRAAELLLGERDIVFVICGDGVMRPQLEQATRSLSNVRLLPLQPRERLGELLRLADIHLLPQSPRAEDLVLPSKLSGMIASGRPVVATCRRGTELESVVSRCGLVVPPDDPVALAEAIRKLAHDPALRAELGRRGRRWAEANVDRNAVLTRMFSTDEYDADLPQAAGSTI